MTKDEIKNARNEYGEGSVLVPFDVSLIVEKLCAQALLAAELAGALREARVMFDPLRHSSPKEDCPQCKLLNTIDALLSRAGAGV